MIVPCFQILHPVTELFASQLQVLCSLALSADSATHCFHLYVWEPFNSSSLRLLNASAATVQEGLMEITELQNRPGFSNCQICLIRHKGNLGQLHKEPKTFGKYSWRLKHSVFFCDSSFFQSFLPVHVLLTTGKYVEVTYFPVSFIRGHRHIREQLSCR